MAPDDQIAIDFPRDEQVCVNEWEGGLLALLGGFVVLMGIVALLNISGSKNGWVLGASAVVLIALGVQMGLQARRGLTVTDDGIDVQNTWRRHRVRWDEARRFDVVWRYAYNSRWLRIELIDGTKLWSPGFHARTERQRETVDGWLAELNRRAGAATDPSTPPPD